LLRTGRVLLAGGLNGVALSSAELFDLAAGDAGLGGFVRTAGDLATARQGATATLLQGGQVLLVGGASEDGGVNLVLSSAELYSP
jgi:hypothetical protein